jgi:hypothetical protein
MTDYRYDPDLDLKETEASEQMDDIRDMEDRLESAIELALEMGRRYGTFSDVANLLNEVLHDIRVEKENLEDDLTAMREEIDRRGGVL